MRNNLWIGSGISGMGGIPMLGTGARGLTTLIREIFRNGGQGFAYDPNDLSTLYQDAAGTIPVTAAGQPVGLMLDKSGRNNHAYQSVSASRPILQQTPILGSELIQDTEFNDSSYWTTSATTSVSGGFANFVAASSGNNINRTDILTLGKTYQLTFTISAISRGSIKSAISLGTGNTPLTNFNKAGTYTVNAVASGTVPTIQLTAIGTTNATVDNISVKEVVGYRTDQNYLEFDGIDDKLTTTLPAQLTGCTVIRSVPNVGAQILTNQTIPTPYDDNIDNYGLIVINQALTTAETAQITKLVNKSAGV